MKKTSLLALLVILVFAFNLFAEGQPVSAAPTPVPAAAYAGQNATTLTLSLMVPDPYLLGLAVGHDFGQNQVCLGVWMKPELPVSILFELLCERYVVNLTNFYAGIGFGGSGYFRDNFASGNYLVLGDIILGARAGEYNIEFKYKVYFDAMNAFEISTVGVIYAGWYFDPYKQPSVPAPAAVPVSAKEPLKDVIKDIKKK